MSQFALGMLAGVTLGGVDRPREGARVVPLMPDMSWLGVPPTEAYARRYEAARPLLIRDASDREIDDVAGELDGTDGERRRRLISRLNELHAERAVLAGGGEGK